MATQDNKQQPDDALNNELTESDAKKLADKHMADPNHIITDEDLSKIKIGVTGEADAPTKQAVEEAGGRVADTKVNSEDDTAPGSQKSTPWDIITP